MLEDYKNPEIIKINNKTTLFKVEKEVVMRIPYIERILPKNYLSLYKQLSLLDIAIPHIEEIIEEENQITVIEEYIESPTLETYCKEQTLTQREIYHIMEQLLDILEVLHHQDPPIIHRDIKPENIFYDGKKVILADFDIARNYRENQEKDTQLLGSIGYAPPEQFGFTQSDARVDIYACGVLLNVLSTHEFPYCQLDKGLFQPIIQKAIQSSPDKRYKNAHEMKQDLEQAIRGNNYVIPGFRHKNKLHGVLASIVYLSVIAMIVQLEDQKGETLFYSIVLKIILLIQFYVTIFYLLDYQPLRRITPFVHHPYKALRIVGRIISYLGFCLVLYFIGAFILFIFPG